LGFPFALPKFFPNYRGGTLSCPSFISFLARCDTLLALPLLINNRTTILHNCTFRINLFICILAFRLFPFALPKFFPNYRGGTLSCPSFILFLARCDTLLALPSFINRTTILHNCTHRITVCHAFIVFPFALEVQKITTIHRPLDTLLALLFGQFITIQYKVEACRHTGADNRRGDAGGIGVILRN